MLQEGTDQALWSLLAQGNSWTQGKLFWMKMAHNHDLEQGMQIDPYVGYIIRGFHR